LAILATIKGFVVVSLDAKHRKMRTRRCRLVTLACVPDQPQREQNG
jgi:hypothetical protein